MINKTGKKSLKRNKEQGEEKKTKMKTTGLKGKTLIVLRIVQKQQQRRQLQITLRRYVT